MFRPSKKYSSRDTVPLIGFSKNLQETNWDIHRITSGFENEQIFNADNIYMPLFFLILS